MKKNIVFYTVAALVVSLAGVFTAQASLYNPVSISGLASVSANNTFTGTNAFNSAFSHFGSGTCNSPNASVSAGGVELCGNDNSVNGIGLIVSNNNAGTSSYAQILFENDGTVGTSSNFASIAYNSIGHNDNTYGSFQNIGNAITFQNLTGPLLFNASTSTNGYIAFATNGVATTSEVMRIAASGNVGIGTTTPVSTFTVVGTTTITTGLTLTKGVAQSGQVACYTTTGSFGHCTSVVGIGGACTCVAN